MKDNNKYKHKALTALLTNCHGNHVTIWALCPLTALLILMTPNQAHAEVSCFGLSNNAVFVVGSESVGTSSIDGNRRCQSGGAINNLSNSLILIEFESFNGGNSYRPIIDISPGVVLYRFLNIANASSSILNVVSCLDQTPDASGQAPCDGPSSCRSNFFCNWSGSLPDGVELTFGSINDLIVGPIVTGGDFNFPAANPLTFSLAHETTASQPGSTAKITYTITNPNTDDRMLADDVTFDHDLAAFAAGVTIAQLPSNNFCGSGSNAEVQPAFGPTFIRFSDIQVGHGQSCVFDVTYTIPPSFTGSLRQLTGPMVAAFPSSVTPPTTVLNTAATEQTITVDGTAPTVVLSSSVAGRTSLTNIPVSVLFSEPVSGFSESDLTVTGAQIENFVNDQAPSEFSSSYSFTLKPTTANSNITVDIASNVAQDAAGNGNEIATQLEIFFSAFPPSIIQLLLDD